MTQQRLSGGEDLIPSSGNMATGDALRVIDIILGALSQVKKDLAADIAALDRADEKRWTEHERMHREDHAEYLLWKQGVDAHHETEERGADGHRRPGQAGQDDAAMARHQLAEGAGAPVRRSRVLRPAGRPR